MTKGKLMFFVIVASFAVGVTALFSVEAQAQFQPCVWPRTCLK